MWQKLTRCYPLQLELIPLTLLILSFYIVLSNYSSLPESIPFHFDAQGNPDDWNSKERIFLLPSIAAAVFVLLTSFNVWFASVNDPKCLINLPEKRKEALTEAQAELLRLFIGRCLFILKILILGLLTYLTWQTVELAMGNVSRLGSLFWLITSVLVIFVVYMVWKSFRLTKAPGDVSV
ncbi:MAG: DUF1648 domain-containing protein [Dehalococcoidia bacterium]|nr:DUF1648 domain-containing protein [Dehalococcoidia bacterium]